MIITCRSLQTAKSNVFFGPAKSVLCFDSRLFPVEQRSICSIKQISLRLLVYTDLTASKQWRSEAIIMHLSAVVFFSPAVIMYMSYIPVVVSQRKCAAAKLPNKPSGRLRELIQNTLSVWSHFRNTHVFHCRVVAQELTVLAAL